MKNSSLLKFTLGIAFSWFLFGNNSNAVVLEVIPSACSVESEVQEDAEVPIEKKREKVRKLLIELKRLDCMSLLAIQVDNLREQLELDESQIRKLSVAAKAVARIRADKWAELMDEYDTWIDALDYIEVAEIDKFENLKEIDIREVPTTMLQWISDDEGYGIVEADLNKNKMWKKALKAVTNEEQEMKLEQIFAEQKEAAADALYDYLAEMLSQKLFLTKDKKNELRKFVEAEIEKRPFKSEFLTMTSEFLDLSMSRLAAADLEEVEKLLSENQLNRWRTLMSPYGPEGFMYSDDADFDFEFAEEDEEDEEDEESLESEVDDQ